MQLVYWYMNCLRIANTECHKEEEQLHKFLLGLDTSFRTVISQIINMKHTAGMITLEELAHDITCSQDTRSEEVAFATYTADKSSVLCSMCNKFWHYLGKFPNYWFS